MRFSEKVVLISGGGTGIGLGAAKKFVAEGAKVVICGRRKEILESACAGIGPKCIFVVGDITKQNDCARIISEALAQYGQLDVLVNSAGVIGSGGVQDTDAAEFDRVMRPNVYGLFYLTKAAVSEIKKTKGCVVNVSSVTGTRPYGNLLAYCASKAAVSMMTQTMALEFAEFGVRVNAVEPGVVRSELHTATDTVQDYPAFLKRSQETHPLGRHGEPEDIANVIAFLASDDASWATGECFKIDGGRHMTSLR